MQPTFIAIFVEIFAKNHCVNKCNRKSATVYVMFVLHMLCVTFFALSQILQFCRTALL